MVDPGDQAGEDAVPSLSRAVAVEVLLHGPCSRAELARGLGVSPATVTRLTKRLIDAGVLAEADAVRTPGRGRSSVPLDVVPDAAHFIGVKLTSESIYGVVTDLRGTVLDSEVGPEPSLRVPDVVAAVAGIVTRLRRRCDHPIRAVGVTVGGRIDAGETVADSPFLHWHEVPFRTLLAEEVGEPLYLANDVVGLTMAQQWFGYGRTYADFALLTVGAGVGYGLVIDHRIVPTHVSPVSHFPIHPHGPLCPQGHRGCATAYVTSGAMCATASQAHGRAVGYDELLDLAQSGDAAAGQVVREAAHALGRLAAAVTSLTGVERIILSGEGVRFAEISPVGFAEGRGQYAAGGLGAVEPVVMRMDFLEWARGAAVLAMQHEFP